MKNIGSQYQPSHDEAPITKKYVAVTLNLLTDVEGLHRAYARDNGIYIRTNTMFVAGTKDFPQDHWEYFPKLQIHITYNTLRYINADKAFKNNDALYPDPKITSLVWHSSGGAVAFEMQKQCPDIIFKTTTYGAPAMSSTTPDTINNKQI